MLNRFFGFSFQVFASCFRDMPNFIEGAKFEKVNPEVKLKFLKILGSEINLF